MRKTRVMLRTIGERIKGLRKSRHMTQSEFAVIMGVSLETVRDWEQGWRYPGADDLLEISQYFGCDLDYLFGQQDTPVREYGHLSEELGITEKAAEGLLHLSRSEDTRTFLSEFFSDPDILFNLSDVVGCDYENSPMMIGPADCSGAVPVPRDLETFGVLAPDVLLKTDKYELSVELSNLIDRVRAINFPESDRSVWNRLIKAEKSTP